MKYQNVDTVSLSRDDYLKLFEWKENNRFLVRFFNPVLEEGVIVVENSMKQFFKQDDTFIEIELFFGSLKALELHLERIGNGQIKVLKEIPNQKVANHLNYPISKMIADSITFHAAAMAYMGYFMEQKIYVDKEVVQKNGNQKKKRKDKTRRKIIKIQHRIYNVRVGGNTKEIKIKREINRRTNQWTVRGHWRKYKDGKKVWVKTYKKGNGTEPQAKIYKM